LAAPPALRIGFRCDWLSTGSTLKEPLPPLRPLPLSNCKPSRTKGVDAETDAALGEA
jgi:hypothetical protein